MNGKRANLVVTDPPYGVSFKSASGLTIQNDSMKNDEFYQFLLASFKNMADNLEPGGSAYVFHADTEGLNFRRAFIDAGFHLAGCCIWAKNSLVLGRSDYQWQHEPVLYGFLKTESTTGTLTGSRPRFGIMISRAEMQTTRRPSRWTFWDTLSGTLPRRTASS